MATSVGKQGWLRWLSALQRRFAGSGWRCQAYVVCDAAEPMLAIWHYGWLRLPRGQLDTDLAVRLEDITEPQMGILEVLSADPRYRAPDSAAFFYQVHNGIIPFKKAQLCRLVRVADIPLHSLIFARRGRRRIRVALSLLEKHSPRLLAQTNTETEILVSAEGYLEKQLRYETVLRACAMLGCAVLPAADTSALARLRTRLNEALGAFQPMTDVTSPLARPADCQSSQAIAAACQDLLAYGQPEDARKAVELCLELISGASADLDGQARFWQIICHLQMDWQEVLALTQKYLLNVPQPQTFWPLLLGIEQPGAVSSAHLRRRLTEEYRRWNARVTHQDAAVRQNAEKMLSIIAALRCELDSQQASQPVCPPAPADTVDPAAAGNPQSFL